MVAYFTVMVPLGQKTLFEHGVAIWRTAEAQALREDLSHTGGQIASEVASTLVSDGPTAPQGPPD